MSKFVIVPREEIEAACARFAKAQIFDFSRRMRSLLKQPSEQLQGEPVAKVVSKYGDPEAFGEREIEVLADLSKIAYGTALYTHADPGEVERLQEELSMLRDEDLKWRGLREQEAEIGALRAKLAERDELLSDIAEEWGSGGQGSEQLWGRIRTYLSASAEPSAPIVHPINMKTLMQAYEQVDHKALLHGTSNWCASMATALRGVLSQEQSAPVERNERAELNDKCAHSYANKVGCPECGETFYGGKPSSPIEMIALRAFVSAACPVSNQINNRGYNWCEAYLDDALVLGRAALERKP